VQWAILCEVLCHLVAMGRVIGTQLVSGIRLYVSPRGLSQDRVRDSLMYLFKHHGYTVFFLCWLARGMAVEAVSVLFGGQGEPDRHRSLHLLLLSHCKNFTHNPTKNLALLDHLTSVTNRFQVCPPLRIHHLL